MTDRAGNDFSQATKNWVALRASHHCSLCGAPTVGPGEESPTAVTNIGVAAHICAASPGGPRYVASMSPAERSDIRNCIWLCSNHAALIDRDSTTYTIEVLRDVKRKHDAARAEELKRAQREPGHREVDLIAFGLDIICTGQLLSVGPTGWQLKVDHFVIGDFNALVDFICKFEALPKGDRYVLVNSLGDGRLLSRAPSATKDRDGYLVSCAVETAFPRTSAHQLGSRWAISPKTNDLYVENGQIARVSGLAALPDNVRSCLSSQRGESPFHPDYGVRLAEFFDAFRGSPWLGQLLKLEVTRQASIPYHDRLLNREYTPLHCIEKVRSLVLLADDAINGWMPVRVDFDVCGVGRWEHELSICLPSKADLEKIKERQNVFAAMGLGVQP
jgi:hypothetical protein